MDENTDCKSQIGSLFIGKVAAMIATFSMPVFLTRFLSKNDYGVYSQYYMIVYFLASFFSLGFQANLYYFYPKASILKRNLVVLQTILLLVLASVISCLFISIPFIADHFLGKELINYKILIITAIVLTIPIGIIEPLYVLRNDKRTSIFYPPSVVILKIIFVVTFTIITNKLIYIFGGFLLSSLLVFLFVIYYVFREFYINGNKIPRIEFSLLREQIAYSLPFGIAVSINALSSRFDKLVCLSYLTTSEYASYSVAFFGIPAIQQIYESFTQVYLVKMSHKWQEDKPDDVLNILKALISKTYSYTIPIILIFILYAKKIIVFLFTENYIDSTPLFQIYLLSFLFIMMGTGLVLRAVGKTNSTLRSYLFSSIISLPSTFFLIKHYGIWGAMIGAMISIILPKLFMISYEIQILNTNISDYFPFRNITRITIISIASITPLWVYESYYASNIFFSIFAAAIYLTIVSILEIRYNLFILESSEIFIIIRRFFGKVPFVQKILNQYDKKGIINTN